MSRLLRLMGSGVVHQPSICDRSRVTVSSGRSPRHWVADIGDGEVGHVLAQILADCGAQSSSSPWTASPVPLPALSGAQSAPVPVVEPVTK
ncbi:MAG: hypothetical protein R2856_15215 [Caldilineaceae bacterium]